MVYNVLVSYKNLITLLTVNQRQLVFQYLERVQLRGFYASNVKYRMSIDAISNFWSFYTIYRIIYVKMINISIIVTILVSMFNGMLTKSVELTFELPDSAEECFYQDIEKNTSAALEYQVITGGQYDVDVAIEAPNKQIIYQQQKMQYDTHQFTAQQTGVYKVCFSNEFSTFSHKLVYMELNVGPEQPLPGVGDHATVLTQLETSAEEIHSALNRIIDHQTHHRLREAQSRKRAEDLNERVFWWSMGESLAIVCVAFAQVMILKNFFSDRPTLYNKL